MQKAGTGASRVQGQLRRLLELLISGLSSSQPQEELKHSHSVQSSLAFSLSYVLNLRPDSAGVEERGSLPVQDQPDSPSLLNMSWVAYRSMLTLSVTSRGQRRLCFHCFSTVAEECLKRSWFWLD